MNKEKEIEVVELMIKKYCKSQSGDRPLID